MTLFTSKHFCEEQGPLSKSYNVKMSSKTQQGAYKNSAIHTCQEHWQNRTKLFKNYIANNTKQHHGVNIMTAELQQ